MAYLDSFTYDIFLSYAHNDDDTSPTQPRGWVTIFREELKTVLKKRLGHEVSIWWDMADLRRNQVIAPAIEKAVKQSAICLALLSRSYVNSDFCKREIAWFCEKAAEGPPGLVLDSHDSRLFNILQYNIPMADWPPQLAGLGGRTFFASDSNDPKNGLGKPLELLTGPIEDLADEIIGTLKKLEQLKRPMPAGQSDTDAPLQRFTVYVADVHGGLALYQNSLIDALQAADIDVLGPAPGPEAPSLIARCQASVHLLNGIPDANALEQIEQGRNAPKQIIWLARQVTIPEDSRTAYQEKLFAIKNHTAANGTIEFMHGGDHWIRDIVESLTKQKRLLMPRNDPRALYIDVRYNETFLSPQLQDLYNYLDDRQVLYEVPHHYHRQSSPDSFVKDIRRAKAVVFFFGHVSKDMVKERFDLLHKEIAQDPVLSRRIEYIGIYAAPPPEKPRGTIDLPKYMDVDWMIDTEGFTPATLARLMALMSNAATV